jgi:hypothetical protein
MYRTSLQRKECLHRQDDPHYPIGGDFYVGLLHGRLPGIQHHPRVGAGVHDHPYDEVRVPQSRPPQQQLIGPQ